MTPPATVTFHFSFDPIPPIMLRGKHALIVVKNTLGQYILGSKKMYPPGIVRFVGGGIEHGEDPTVGAAREIQEELGMTVKPEELKPLAVIEAHVSSHDTQVVFTTYLYGINVGDAVLTPADDLDGLAYLSSQEVEQLIHNFRTLPTDLAKKNTTKPFRWSDYGALYAEVHNIGLEKTVDL